MRAPGTVGWAGVFALAALACGAKVELPGESGGASAGTSTTGDTAGTGGPLVTSASPTTADTTTSAGTGSAVVGGVDADSVDDTFLPDWGLPPLQCSNPDHACSAPILCEFDTCGDLYSPFDDAGCLRQACQAPTDCATDEVCFRPQDYGGCASSGTFCFDDEFGNCTCASDPDCGGAYCVPADLAPPTACEQYSTPDECFDAGCSAFLDASQLLISDNTCFCNLTEVCLWIPPDSMPSPEPVGYYWPGLPGVHYFEVSFNPPPFGWMACGTGFEEPPECFQCFDELEFCV